MSHGPGRTLLACAFFAALAMYLLGALGILNRPGAVVPLTAAMSVLGVALSAIHSAPVGVSLPCCRSQAAGNAVPGCSRSHPGSRTNGRCGAVWYQ